MSAELVQLDPALLAPPLVAGLLVLATHVPLGIEVLRRGIIFIDLAIAQVAALGVIAAGLLQFDDRLGGAGVQVAAGFAALVGAAFLTWTERRWPEVQEALIGLVFVFAAALGILLLAGSPQGGEHLRDLLAGQILWVGWGRLLPVGIATALLLAAWWILRRRGWADGFAFYALFACAVTVSVQLVGVLLVFASLIAPAVATHGASGERRLLKGYLMGALAYALGLGLSLVYDLPAGTTVVCGLGLAAFGGLARIKA